MMEGLSVALAEEDLMLRPWIRGLFRDFSPAPACRLMAREVAAHPRLAL
jgi:hypothetical protein